MNLTTGSRYSRYFFIITDIKIHVYFLLYQHPFAGRLREGNNNLQRDCYNTPTMAKYTRCNRYLLQTKTAEYLLSNSASRFDNSRNVIYKPSSFNLLQVLTVQQYKS